jgi:nucleotide-binding universal stress UspA family protein
MVCSSQIEERRRPMGNKILLALDSSKGALKAVRYVAKHLNRDATVTMFSVLPEATDACGLDGPSVAPVFRENIKAFCTIEQAKKSAVQGFMEEAKKTLVKAGFPPKNVSIRLRKKKVGIARDILKEASLGKYDTIVVGRRGLTGVRKFFSGSVTNKVYQSSHDVAVLVVG